MDTYIMATGIRSTFAIDTQIGYAGIKSLSDGGSCAKDIFVESIELEPLIR